MEVFKFIRLIYICIVDAWQEYFMLSNIVWGAVWLTILQNSEDSYKKKWLSYIKILTKRFTMGQYDL